MNRKNYEHDPRWHEERERGMIVGMLIFFPFGAALFLATGNPGLIGAGVAAGLSIGLAIGEYRYRRNSGEG